MRDSRTRKLVIRKETLRSLEAEHLDRVAGGTSVWSRTFGCCPIQATDRCTYKCTLYPCFTDECSLRCPTGGP